MPVAYGNAIARAPAGRGIANQATELFGANRGSPVLPTGCRIRVHDRQHRSRTGATRSRFDQFDAGSAQGISAHKIEEAPAAGFEQRFFHLVSEAGKSRLLRPLDARVFSRWPEISAYRSRRSE